MLFADGGFVSKKKKPVDCHSLVLTDIEGMVYCLIIELFCFYVCISSTSIQTYIKQKNTSLSPKPAYDVHKEKNVSANHEVSTKTNFTSNGGIIHWKRTKQLFRISDRRIQGAAKFLLLFSLTTFERLPFFRGRIVSLPCRATVAVATLYSLFWFSFGFQFAFLSDQLIKPNVQRDKFKRDNWKRLYRFFYVNVFPVETIFFHI